MNIPAAITVSSLSLGFGGVAAWFAFAPGAREAQAAPPTAPTVERSNADADAKLAALTREMADLRDQIALAASMPTQRVSAIPSDEAIAAAVERYLAGQGAKAPAEAAAAAATFTSAEDALALLEAAGSTEEAQAIWKKLIEAGLDEEVLALFRAAADAAPNDPDAQLALGNAYIALTQEATGMAQGKYATLADKALDKALALDPEHWEARFTKAIALSFWPPVFGKQGQAIEQFETLIEQQSRVAPAAQHASTHLLLGNMYQQSGQMEKAIAAWRAGLELFPNDPELAAQLQTAGAGR